MGKKNKQAGAGRDQAHHSRQRQATDAFALQQAVRCHEAGLFDEAERRYQQILLTQPQHPQALLLLGFLYLGARRYAPAADATRRAVAANPQHPVAHCNLGMALLGTGRSDQAIGSFERAIALKPDYVEACNNLGLARQNLGDYADSVICFDRAIAWAPQLDAAWSNRGISLQKQGRHEEAVASFDRALAINPINGVACNNRGISLLALGRYEAALSDFRQAIELDAAYAEAFSNCGLALQTLERNEEAVASFDRALALNPDNSQAYSHRGMSLLRLGRLEDAVDSLNRALGAAPASVDVLNNRGIVFQHLGRLDEALACFHQALSLDPRRSKTLNNLGNVRRDMNEGEAALDCYAQALANDDGDTTVHLNAALCHLLLGDFKRGWPAFEWRWKTEKYRAARREFAAPLWLGAEDLTGRTILLHAEQGFGDTIQFCRYARCVAERGATVLLEVQAPLKSLMATLDGVSQVLAKGETLPEFDYHCPLMSLPLAFATELSTIPASGHYLSSDPGQQAQWHERLPATGKEPRIGIAWSGNPGFANDRNRSIPLANFARLFSTQAQFVSLQPSLRPGEREIFEANDKAVHCGDLLRDFSDTAALIDTMDLVIAVDTAVAHLAGALGKPVWVLLPYNNDWRWQLGREDSPWYPSARLFRQTRPGEWDETLARTAAALSANATQNQIG
ncbi:Tfp pilus assembly protein PilF [Propionivibrio dicarboxylicus]|uniref:Tfp pilus assembly protein PilF n=1 Tax=Propionivibrio dicarboxylicus TaxID=83767 RepID=A0A1G8I4Q9_9RHOO|nr:Tfp pilus assembly protein PilF [Propionivibrio dicarboxylicus]